MRRTKRQKPKIVCKNGRYYEDGKLLRKRDYAVHFSAHEPDYLLTDNGKYRMSEVIYS